MTRRVLPLISTPTVDVRVALCALFFPLFSACGVEEPAPSLPSGFEAENEPETPIVLPAPRSLKERLERGGVALVPDHSAPAFQIHVAQPNGAPRPVGAELAMSSAAEVSIDDRGRIALDDLTLQVGDIELSEETFPPHGLHLTDIRAVIEASALDVTWAEDGASAVFEGRASLRIEWTLIGRSGNRIDLRPIEAGEGEIIGALAGSAEGPITAGVQGRAAGVLLHVVDLIDLSDLSFGLRLVSEQR